MREYIIVLINIISILFIIVLIGIDRITKYYAVLLLKPVGEASFLPGILSWKYIENRGMAFGFFQGKQFLLIIVTAIALLVILFVIFFKKPEKKIDLISLILIFSGGAGNLIDRIVQGYVVDFANFDFMNFAIFNFADVLITCGVAILVVSIIYAEFFAARKKKAAKITKNQQEAVAQDELDIKDNEKDEQL